MANPGPPGKMAIKMGEMLQIRPPPFHLLVISGFRQVVHTCVSDIKQYNFMLVKGSDAL